MGTLAIAPFIYTISTLFVNLPGLPWFRWPGALQCMVQKDVEANFPLPRLRLGGIQLVSTLDNQLDRAWRSMFQPPEIEENAVANSNAGQGANIDGGVVLVLSEHDLAATQAARYSGQILRQLVAIMVKGADFTIIPIVLACEVCRLAFAGEAMQTEADEDVHFLGRVISLSREVDLVLNRV